MRFATSLLVASLVAVGVTADTPVDIPCVTWEPLTFAEPTPDPSTLFLAAYTWVTAYENGEVCDQKGDIFPCFNNGTNTFGHHDYLQGQIPNDYCRTSVNNQVVLGENFFVPKKGPKWHTWKWKLAQSGGPVPDNAIRFGDSVMARSTVNGPGKCCGKGFTGWAEGKDDGTFGAVHFTIQNSHAVTESFEVAICEAYKPTPAPPTPAPFTPTPPTMKPTLPPNNKPYIRFGHTIPTSEHVDATITQGSLTYTWSDFQFGQFSSWVELFHDGPGVITIHENNNGTQGALLVTKDIPLTPGPLVVVVKDLWPPRKPTSVETIAASYVPEPIPTDSGVRLFNLASDVVMAGMKSGEQQLVSHVAYTIGSTWAPIPVKSATFTVFDQATGKTLATTTTQPPHNPFVFTNFLIGLQNATANSAYRTQIVPLIDAPEA